jgi:putative inorganic carbon (hco3(-)) transporter
VKSLASGERLPWVEGVVLAAAAPFLLFPTLVPLATAVSLAMIAFLWLWPLLRREPPLAVTPFNLALLCFSLMIGVAILVTADPDLALPQFATLILGLTLWRYLSQHVYSWGQWRLALIIFGVIGLAFMGLGVLAADWMYKIAGVERLLAYLPPGIVNLPGRTEGIHPNMLAAATLPYFTLLPALLYRSVWEPGDRRYGFILAGGWLLTTAVLLITQSRSAYMGAAAGGLALLLVGIILMPDSRWRNWLLAGFALLLLAGSLGLQAIGVDNIQSIWDDPRQQTSLGSTASLGFRQEVWRWSIVAVSDFPFTGVGLGSFSRVIRRFYPVAVAPTYEITHAHNIYLQMALDVGLVGLIAYLSIIMTALGIIWGVARQNHRLRPVALGLGAGFIAYLMFGLTDAVPLGAKPALLFWYVLGLVTILPRLDKAD